MNFCKNNKNNEYELFAWQALLLENNGVNNAIIGSSNFTVRGLGLIEQSNIELNLEVDSWRDREDLYRWFQEIWNDETLVENVNDQVLEYLEQLYQENDPEFIYFKTLFHIFLNFLLTIKQLKDRLY